MMMIDGLRAFVDVVEKDVLAVSARAAPQDAAEVARLARSWAKLVDHLALGPAPELRDCPHCGATGNSAATRCGACWAKLVPPEGHVASP